jgi:hypothetical protein
VRPFACDSLDPKVCLDIYQRRNTMVRILVPGTDNKACQLPFEHTTATHLLRSCGGRETPSSTRQCRSIHRLYRTMSRPYSPAGRHRCGRQRLLSQRRRRGGGNRGPPSRTATLAGVTRQTSNQSNLCCVPGRRCYAKRRSAQSTGWSDASNFRNAQAISGTAAMIHHCGRCRCPGSIMPRVQRRNLGSGWNGVCSGTFEGARPCPNSVSL